MFATLSLPNIPPLSTDTQSSRCFPNFYLLLEQQKNDPNATGLVVINSFDFELEDIRDEMIDRKIFAEVFEIDRLRPDSRLEYLNCF